MITIFLDVDGVLNHRTSRGWKTQDSNLVIDDNCLANYNKIIKHLEQNKVPYRVILSSTWRCYDDAKKALTDKGIIWDAQVPAAWDQLGTRHENIQRFVTYSELEPDHVIIIDDDTSLANQGWGDQWIKTRWNGMGLNDECLATAINVIDATYERCKKNN